MSPSNIPNKKITSGTRSDSHLLGQESEVYSDHSSGGSLGSFSFGEDSTTIANTQQGVVGKVLLDEVAESTSTKSSEDASEKQLQSGNKKSFKFVVHDYEVSSPEWDANASKFFRRWGFAKYGRKKECPRCKELYEKGHHHRSMHLHVHLLPVYRNPLLRQMKLMKIYRGLKLSMTPGTFQMIQVMKQIT